MLSAWRTQILQHQTASQGQPDLPIITHNKGLEVELSLQTSCRWMGLGLGHKLTDLDSIAAAFRKIHLGNSPPCVLGPDLFKQRAGVLQVGKRTDLDTQDPHSFRSWGIADDPKLDLICPITRHAKGLGSRQREVQDSPSGKRPAVVDPDRHMTAGG